MRKYVLLAFRLDEVKVSRYLAANPSEMTTEKPDMTLPVKDLSPPPSNNCQQSINR
jgi:hypothetical protein